MTASDRLLVVLRALNEMRSGTVLELYRETKIPRAAIYRVLETLCEHGYAQRVPGHKHYRLTSKIRTLSSGFVEEEWIVESAVPAIQDLQARLKWPTSLATLDRDSMIIRETTRHRSPFVFDPGAVGGRLPVLHTAIGLAYLAFCNPRSRRIALDLLSHTDEAPDDSTLDADAVDRLLTTTRHRGYGYRKGGFHKNTSSLACPVMGEDGAVAAIGMSFVTSAVRPQDAIANFLPALRDASQAISRHLSSRYR